METYLRTATPQDIKTANLRTCYDCKTETDDYVLETRQTSGGGQGDNSVYAGDFTKVPVHANRRDCQAAIAKREKDFKRSRDPFYDVPAR
jgi:hypothetical protein